MLDEFFPAFVLVTRTVFLWLPSEGRGQPHVSVYRQRAEMLERCASIECKHIALNAPAYFLRFGLEDAACCELRVALLLLFDVPLAFFLCEEVTELLRERREAAEMRAGSATYSLFPAGRVLLRRWFQRRS